MLNWIATLALSLAIAPALAINPNSPGAASSAPGGSPDILFQKSAREVQIGFHLAQEEQPSKELRTDQLTLYQDGQRTEITGIYADQDLPLRLVLMLDTSASMSTGFARGKTTAIDFLHRVVRPNIDRSTVMTFSTHATLDATANAAPTSFRGIALRRPSGLTALFDSICEATAQMADASASPRGTRNVMVLLSDGDDNYSRLSLDDAISAAQRADLAIYAITVQSDKNAHWGDANLKELTTETGGRVFFLKKFGQYEAVFADLEREIRSQYTVTFRLGESTCGFHGVRVEAVDRKLRLRSRSGFYRACP